MHESQLAGSFSNSFSRRGARMLEEYKMQRGKIFGAMIVAAMLAFEVFNFSTTDFALTNLLGDLRFLGVRWAVILAIAFCGMDFAGIARLFTPESERGERGGRTEVWYLLAAWFLAATMNAMLTWWGVSIALLSHPGLGNEILDRETLLSVVPVFVAMLVWLIRILLIGMLAMAGDRLFSHLEDAVRRNEQAEVRAPAPPVINRLPTAEWQGGSARPANNNAARTPSRAAPRTVGGDSLDDFEQPRRPSNLAEQHAQRRSPPQRNPAPPPPQHTTRPAPKPSSMVRAGGESNGHHDLD